MAYGREIDSFRKSRLFIFGIEYESGMEDILIRLSIHRHYKTKYGYNLVIKRRKDKRPSLLEGQFMMLIMEMAFKIIFDK